VRDSQADGSAGATTGSGGCSVHRADRASQPEKAAVMDKEKKFYQQGKYWRNFD